jgi:hypothetical protein
VIEKKIMRKILSLGTIVLLSFIAVFLAACDSGRRPAENSNGAVAGNTTTITEAAHRVEFSSEPAEIQANQPTTLSFFIKNKQGAIVKDLQIVHEKPMHLLIVSTDLAEFYHVHPEPFPDGSYRVQHTFPSGGDYKLYADFTPSNAQQMVERVDLKVAGPERAKVALIPDTRFEKSVDGLKVVMKPDGKLEAGKDVMLNFQAFDAASGTSATDLQNYLGELAHLVIISEDMVDFVHAHPMSTGEPMEEMEMDKQNDHNSDGHSHSSETKDPGKPSASEVSAHTSFPRAGLYKLWAQFQRGGRVISVPFIVNIPTGSAEPAKAANVPEGATQITVSGSGYTPESISVKKGQPVKLAFYRSDANNCGGEVVFAKQNIRKKLPVGKTVLVEFTPTDTGEISFACGMDMLRGRLIVSEN